MFILQSTLVCIRVFAITSYYAQRNRPARPWLAVCSNSDGWPCVAIAPLGVTRSRVIAVALTIILNRVEPLRGTSSVQKYRRLRKVVVPTTKLETGNTIKTVQVLRGK